MRPHFPAGRRGRIVEWGSGTGEFTKRFQREADILAIEPNEAMRQIASSKGVKSIDGDVCYCDISVEDSHYEADAHCLMFATFSYATVTDRLLNMAMHVLRCMSHSGSGLIFDVVNYAAAHAALFDRDTISPCETVRCQSRKTFDFTDSIVTCENTYKMLPDGQEWVEVHKMRAFTPTEITGHLRRSGFVVKDLFDPEHGGTCIKHCPYYFGVHAVAV